MSDSAPVHALVVLAPLCAVSFALAWAALSDFRRYIIPNAASAVVAIAYIAMAVCEPRADVIGDVALAVAALLLGATLFATGRMGGGDVKLFASLSLWAGPALIAPFALVTCAAAFILSLLMLSPLVSFMPAAPPSAAAMTGSAQGARRPMPFGVAIVAGGFYLVARHLAEGH